MKTTFKPLLAADAKIENVRFPVLASPKIDGIRCLIRDRSAVTRSLKLIPNRSTRNLLQQHAFEGFDGELVIDQDFEQVRSSDATFLLTQSAVMTQAGSPRIIFYVFDDCRESFRWKGYKDRYTFLEEIFEASTTPVPINPLYRFSYESSNGFLKIRLLRQTPIWDRQSLENFYSECLENGFEGVMLRSLEGVYKHGRSTEKEGILLKQKPFDDAEATIIGFVEKQHNTNPAQTNLKGETERSTRASGMVGADTLGCLRVRGLGGVFDGKEFEIGTGLGLTHPFRKQIWDNQKNYLGKVVKFKYQSYGGKDLPRLPVFIGFRSPLDL